MKPIQIAKLFGISSQNVNLLDTSSNYYPQKRRMNLTRNLRSIIIK